MTFANKLNKLEQEVFVTLPLPSYLRRSNQAVEEFFGDAKMKELTIILLMAVISVTESKTVINGDKSVSQVRDQSEDGDEILVTAEQVFLPRFTMRARAAARRRGQVQRRNYNTKKSKPKTPPRRKYNNNNYYWQNWKPAYNPNRRYTFI